MAPEKSENRSRRRTNKNEVTEETGSHRSHKWSKSFSQKFSILGVILLLLNIFARGATAFKAPDANLKLSKEDMEFLFGNKEAPPHSLISIESRSREKRSSSTLTEDPGVLDVTVKDEEESIEFELRPNTDLISPNFVLVVLGDDGDTKETGVVSPGCIYKGVAKGHPETVAALANCDGRGFTGVIVSNEFTHLVKPLKNSSLRKRRRRRRQANDSDDQDDDEEDNDDITPDGLHIIHTRTKDAKCAVFNLQAMKAPRLIVKLPQNFSDGDDDDEVGNVEKESDDDKESDENNGFYKEDSHKSHEGSSHMTEGHNLQKRAASERLQIETAVFVDDDLYNTIKTQNPDVDVVETVTNVVFAIMNGVHLLYNAPSLDIHFSITIVRLEIITTATKGPLKSSGDIQRYLSNFCYWQKNKNRKENPRGDKSTGFWDHALMLSGMELWDGKPEFDSVIGLAWVAGMCHPTYSCTINEGTSFEAVYVITHEIGHNLGMSHDGSVADKNSCEGESYIMSASTGPGKVTWSKCSNNEVKTFLKNADYAVNCLDDLTRGPRDLDITGLKLPGEAYSIDQQCTYALGSTFKPYVTSKYPYNNVCRETWCQNTTHAMRTHPALEGTSCGIKKFCVNGKCSTKPKKTITTTTTNKPRTTLTTTTTGTTATTTTAPRRGGFRDLFRRIRNLFKRYLFMRNELPPTAFMSKWKMINQSPCTAACGGGWLVSNVTCITSVDHIPVEDDLCDPAFKPPNVAACNTTPCSAKFSSAAASKSSSPDKKSLLPSG